MRRLNSYFLKESLYLSGLTATVLLVIVWLTQSLRFLDMIVNKGLSIMVFFQLTGLLVPMLLQVILPLAFFIGTALTLKRWHDDNELNSLFAHGYSRKQLVQPLMIASMLVVALSYFINLWALPISKTEFKELQHKIRHQEAHLLVQPGTFNQLGNGVMVYMRERDGYNRLRQLLVHDSRDPAQPVTWMARHGEVVASDNGQPMLVLEQGIRQDVAPNRVSMLEFERHTLDITQRYGPLPERTAEADERTLYQLRGLGEKLSPQQRMEFKAEFHKRLLWPLLPLMFGCLMAIFMIRPQPPRMSSMRPVLMCSVIVFGLQALLMALNNMAAQGMPVVLQAQWFIPAAVIIFTWLYMGEQR